MAPASGVPYAAGVAQILTLDESELSDVAEGAPVGTPHKGIERPLEGHPTHRVQRASARLDSILGAAHLTDRFTEVNCRTCEFVAGRQRPAGAGLVWRVLG
jgi:hypothetical protein